MQKHKNKYESNIFTVWKRDEGGTGGETVFYKEVEDELKNRSI